MSSYLIHTHHTSQLIQMTFLTGKMFRLKEIPLPEMTQYLALSPKDKMVRQGHFKLKLTLGQYCLHRERGGYLNILVDSWSYFKSSWMNLNPWAYSRGPKMLESQLSTSNPSSLVKKWMFRWIQPCDCLFWSCTLLQTATILDVQCWFHTQQN